MLFDGWVYLEADFVREYNIDLLTTLDTMTWRRFGVLVRGLGPNSAFRAYVTHKDEQPIEDADTADRALSALFGA